MDATRSSMGRSMDSANVSAGSNWSEIAVSNQRSVRKINRGKIHMPKVTLMGKLAKVKKGPAKKIGKEK